MTRLENKQEELIAHYEIKPIVRGMSPTKEWNDWNDKKYQLLDEIAALKQQGEPVSAEEINPYLLHGEELERTQRTRKKE